MSKNLPKSRPYLNLGQAVRTRRKLLKLTQTELARFAGCGPIFIHQLERGKQSVRLDKMVEVLNVLGLQLELVVGKNGLVISPTLKGK